MNNILGAQRLRWWSERVRRLVSAPAGLILSYHRITESVADPHELCVSPGNFREHMEVLREHCQVLSLPHLMRKVATGASIHNAVAITLDDGYFDNFSKAMPILEQYGFPATVFAVSGYVNGMTHFWWDELGRIILQPGSLPARLELRVNGDTHEWKLDKDAHYCEEFWRCHIHWRFASRTNPTLRHRLYRSLYFLLRDLPRERQQELLDQLWKWAGMARRSSPAHRLLGEDDLQRLARTGLVEIGSHSLTHADFSKLAAAEQRTEIVRGKEALEQLVGRAVTSFAYPYGVYTGRTVSVVREAGFSSACTRRASAVWPRCDPLRLPRVGIGNWDADMFARRVASFL